jgi:hypothetical protein
MNQQTTAEEWSRRVRVLDHTEIALLSKNALEFRNLMSTYNVDEPSDRVTAEGLDVVFAKWLEDRSPPRMSEPKLIAVLGITFGNYLCDILSMQWAEVTDDVGTTYAVLHETAEVYCFPLEAVKKRTMSREIGFFAGIEAAVREDISKTSTKQRE